MKAFVCAHLYGARLRGCRHTWQMGSELKGFWYYRE